MRKRTDSAADLADRDRVFRSQQPFAIAAHFVEPKREGQAKRRRFGVNAVRAPDLRRVLELEGAPSQRLHQLVYFRQQNVCTHRAAAER